MFGVSKIYLFIVIFISSTAYAYPPSIFDIQEQLETATLVCYAKTISLEAHKVITSKGETVQGWLAKVDTISIIKGDAAAHIDVLFRGDSNEQMHLFATLSKDEAAILFLKKLADGTYQFLNEENSKLEVPAHKALEYKSATPQGRLVEELLFATLNDNTPVGLRCIEELQHFPTPEVIAHLKDLSKKADMGTQGVAYAMLVVLDEPPEVDRLLAFFKREDGKEQFPTAPYSIYHLKLQIIEEMETRLDIICRDHDLQGTDKKHLERRDTAQSAATKWKHFDVVSLIAAILEEDSKKNLFESDKQGIIYREMADILHRQIDTDGRPAESSKNIRPGTRRLLVKLFQREQLEVQYSAATAINVLLANTQFSYPQSGDKNAISLYVEQCRLFLKQHPDWVNGDEK